MTQSSAEDWEDPADWVMSTWPWPELPPGDGELVRLRSQTAAPDPLMTMLMKLREAASASGRGEEDNSWYGCFRLCRWYCGGGGGGGGGTRFDVDDCGGCGGGGGSRWISGLCGRQLCQFRCRCCISVDSMVARCPPRLFALLLPLTGSRLLLFPPLPPVQLPAAAVASANLAFLLAYSSPENTKQSSADEDQSDGFGIAEAEEGDHAANEQQGQASCREQAGYVKVVCGGGCGEGETNCTVNSQKSVATETDRMTKALHALKQVRPIRAFFLPQRSSVASEPDAAGYSRRKVWGELEAAGVEGQGRGTREPVIGDNNETMREFVAKIFQDYDKSIPPSMYTGVTIKVQVSTMIHSISGVNERS
uniref:Uncharacterized protein n=1 Tax=Macrostomum lignano TaxID=282301 RepID=A0A1I8G5F9_9PLAT